MATQSSPGGFLLLGGLERIVFAVVLTSYLLTQVGNTLIILMSVQDPKLHSPVYFFLSDLSFLDLRFTMSSILQMLANLWGPKPISFFGCSVQLFIFLFLGTTECTLLTVMASNCCVATCQHPHYTTSIQPCRCQQLASMAGVTRLLESVVQTPPPLRLPLCSHRQMEDFVCEVPALITLSCGTTTYNEIQMAAASTLILVSYCAIAQAVLRINSAEEWRKMFGTFSFHLTVVTLLYSSVIAVYLQPQSSYARKRGKFLGLFYAVGTPAFTLSPEEQGSQESLQEVAGEGQGHKEELSAGPCAFQSRGGPRAIGRKPVFPTSVPSPTVPRQWMMATCVHACVLACFLPVRQRLEVG
ncbi:unnamed protein product [Gulo gulo]|uniref:G-protein coupled receptors family 1 profile domain-containing protein n=1 Tax=Gulo gulo TaxID=48420 RepID=A0A9X9PXS3_GULGU|nr:unnamed protein product [Gulo gulo]